MDNGFDFNAISTDMLSLGLGALAHANYHSGYTTDTNDKWAELSVIQAAHAAELLVKARITKEHPIAYRCRTAAKRLQRYDTAPINFPERRGRRGKTGHCCRAVVRML